MNVAECDCALSEPRRWNPIFQLQRAEQLKAVEDALLDEKLTNVEPPRRRQCREVENLCHHVSKSHVQTVGRRNCDAVDLVWRFVTETGRGWQHAQAGRARIAAR